MHNYKISIVFWLPKIPIPTYQDGNPLPVTIEFRDRNLNESADIDGCRFYLLQDSDFSDDQVEKLGFHMHESLMLEINITSENEDAALADGLKKSEVFFDQIAFRIQNPVLIRQVRLTSLGTNGEPLGVGTLWPLPQGYSDAKIFRSYLSRRPRTNKAIAGKCKFPIGT